MTDTDNTPQVSANIDLEHISFHPVSNVEGEDAPEGAVVEQKKKERSERLEKLRAYYGELGSIRDAMEEELQKALEGETKEGEIEDKIYKSTHSRKVILEEIKKYDGEHGKSHVADGEYHVGEVLAGADYTGANLAHADFSAANLQDADLTNANLSGADFTGADLSGANLSGADLSDAIFAGASLKGTNFTGANMEGVILRDADIEDAILMDIRMDELAIEELQALVEYLAIYYPHKLNLLRINLSLLDLSRIDLRQVNLRGVDFTGMDFTGVNIMELDLSECIITPEQIAQALGRVPSLEELQKILAPKNKKKKKKFYIDWTEFLSDGHFKGWTDLTKSYITTEQLVKGFLKVKNALTHHAEEKDEVIFEKAQEFYAERLAEDRKAYNEEQKKNIEERKQKMLEEQQAGHEKATKGERYVPIKVHLERE